MKHDETYKTYTWNKQKGTYDKPTENALHKWIQLFMDYLSQLVSLVWILYDCSENYDGSMNSVCMNCTTNEMLVNEVYIYLWCY